MEPRKLKPTNHALGYGMRTTGLLVLLDYVSNLFQFPIPPTVQAVIAGMIITLIEFFYEKLHLDVKIKIETKNGNSEL